jgi:hypothetical protein
MTREQQLWPPTANTEKIKGGYYSVLGPFWATINARLGVTAWMCM